VGLWTEKADQRGLTGSATTLGLHRPPRLATKIQTQATPLTNRYLDMCNQFTLPFWVVGVMARLRSLVRTGLPKMLVAG
jgi:hypothetical protein